MRPVLTRILKVANAFGPDAGRYVVPISLDGGLQTHARIAADQFGELRAAVVVESPSHELWNGGETGMPLFMSLCDGAHLLAAAGWGSINQIQMLVKVSDKHKHELVMDAVVLAIELRLRELYEAEELSRGGEPSAECFLEWLRECPDLAVRAASFYCIDFYGTLRMMRRAESTNHRELHASARRLVLGPRAARRHPIATKNSLENDLDFARWPKELQDFLTKHFCNNGAGGFQTYDKRMEEMNRLVKMFVYDGNSIPAWVMAMTLQSDLSRIHAAALRESNVRVQVGRHHSTDTAGLSNITARVLDFLKTGGLAAVVPGRTTTIGGEPILIHDLPAAEGEEGVPTFEKLRALGEAMADTHAQEVLRPPRRSGDVLASYKGLNVRCPVTAEEDRRWGAEDVARGGVHAAVLPVSDDDFAENEFSSGRGDDDGVDGDFANEYE
jgi:hypothetical protein